MYETDRWMRHYINGVRMNCVSEMMRSSVYNTGKWLTVYVRWTLAIFFIYLLFSFLNRCHTFPYVFHLIAHEPGTHDPSYVQLTDLYTCLFDWRVACILYNNDNSNRKCSLSDVRDGIVRKIETQPQTDNLVHLVCTHRLENFCYFYLSSLRKFFYSFGHFLLDKRNVRMSIDE